MRRRPTAAKVLGAALTFARPVGRVRCLGACRRRVGHGRFALGAVLWHLSAAMKVPALVLVSSVERGEVIDANDVGWRTSSDDALARPDGSQLDRVVGRGRRSTWPRARSSRLDRRCCNGPGPTAWSAFARLLVRTRHVARPGAIVNAVRSADVAELEADPAVSPEMRPCSPSMSWPVTGLLVSVLQPRPTLELGRGRGECWWAEVGAGLAMKVISLASVRAHPVTTTAILLAPTSPMPCGRG